MAEDDEMSHVYGPCVLLTVKNMFLQHLGNSRKFVYDLVI